MAWVYLILAGVCETGFTTALRYVENFTRVPPTLVFVLFATASLYLLQQASTAIPLGTAYAVWTGIGAGGTALIGMMVYQEPVTILRLVFLVQLITSIIGLKFVSAE